MTENLYRAQIEQLLTGERTEIIVEQTEFMQFRQAWLVHPERKKIVGEAGLNGRVVYKFIKEN